MSECDLIERLRAQQIVKPDSLTRLAKEPNPLCQEAANTIARLSEALESARIWHEAQDKALSKSGRGDAGYHCFRAQHQEQIAEINAALKVGHGRDADEAGPGASDDGPVDPASVSGA